MAIPDPSRYAVCGDHPRLKEDNIFIDKALDKMILDETRILPLFETRYHHYREKRSVSLVQNEFLECRWSEFMKTCHQKTMFRFPTVDDLHFSNYSIRYLPKESIRNRVDNRLRLRMGPGVDKYGQIPVPDDVNVRKTVNPKTTEAKKARNDAKKAKNDAKKDKNETKKDKNDAKKDKNDAKKDRNETKKEKNETKKDKNIDMKTNKNETKKGKKTEKAENKITTSEKKNESEITLK
ncbi:uncharacterized protein LOC110375747 [Helicoverpa armigera]|uniref:uncharacterized protein LOC110375747 n=1 Tax=Helicoverpa armigera TaxID=29058 RepID=UPI003082B2EA